MKPLEVKIEAKYLNDKVWVGTHQEQKFVKKME